MSTNFPALLEKHGQEIARALPKHLTPARMIRVALTAFRLQPKLAQCDPRSVFAAVIQASQLGLEIGGPMAEAHLVPFKTECQLITGYQGLMKLARNTGQINGIYAYEVRERDEFRITFGLHRDLHHVPLIQNGFLAPDETRGAITGFYAVATFKDGTTAFTAMSRVDVEAVRNNSAGYKVRSINSPWTTHFAAMGIKTVIRRLCKFLPKSPELAIALTLESRAEQGVEQKITLENAIQGEYLEEEYDANEEPSAPPPTPPTDPIAITLINLIATAGTLPELEEIEPKVVDYKGKDRDVVKMAYKGRKTALQAAQSSAPPELSAATEPTLEEDYLKGWVVQRATE